MHVSGKVFSQRKHLPFHSYCLHFAVLLAQSYCHTFFFKRLAIFISLNDQYYHRETKTLGIWEYQGRRNGFGIGGGGAKNFARRRNFFFHIKLTYKKATFLFISISVISKIHRVISLFCPYLYTLIYMSLFLNSSFFCWQNMGGGAIAPPLPPVPTAMSIF